MATSTLIMIVLIAVYFVGLLTIIKIDPAHLREEWAEKKRNGEL